jgi:hypothetical protein
VKREPEIASTEDDDPQPERALSASALDGPDARGEQKPDQAGDYTADPHTELWNGSVDRSEAINRVGVGRRVFGDVMNRK